MLCLSLTILFQSLKCPWKLLFVLFFNPQIMYKKTPKYIELPAVVLYCMAGPRPTLLATISHCLAILCPCGKPWPLIIFIVYSSANSRSSTTTDMFHTQENIDLLLYYFIYLFIWYRYELQIYPISTTNATLNVTFCHTQQAMWKVVFFCINYDNGVIPFALNCDAHAP